MPEVPSAATVAEAQAELASVLASTCFRRSPRLSTLLNFLCQRAFAGEAEGIKEYTIGVEVLGRGPTFDPGADASARVEMHRLRKRLREYYEQDGHGSRIRIVIPPGQYVPQFVVIEDPAPDAAPNAAPAPPASEPARSPEPRHSKQSARQPWNPWRPLAAMALFGTLILLYSAYRGTPAPADRSSAREARSGAASQGPAVRIDCGAARAHTDPWGQRWEADTWARGGDPYVATRETLERTFDPQLFLTARTGDFTYDIPLPSGTYELRLMFAETQYGAGNPSGGGEASRTFVVSANDRTLLTDFDILSDADGPNVADVRVFKNISPGNDGLLHLSFRSQRSKAIVSAIEVIAAEPNRLNPIRMIMQDRFYTSKNGDLWTPDNYVTGGQLAVHPGRVEGNYDPELFDRERYGHFSYAIPVDEGTYRLTLYMAERHFGISLPGRVGARIFDVLCNGQMLAHKLDLFAESGVNKAIVKTFRGLEADAQGKLRISFVPQRDYASLYALEVVDESK